MEEPQIQAEPEFLFWMFTVNIVYNLGGLEKNRLVNILATTQTPFITETILANVNQNAQIQGMEHGKLPKKAKVIDCVIVSNSLLGQMTQSQFHNLKKAVNNDEAQ